MCAIDCRAICKTLSLDAPDITTLHSQNPEAVHSREDIRWYGGEVITIEEPVKGEMYQKDGACLYYTRTARPHQFFDAM